MVSATVSAPAGSVPASAGEPRPRDRWRPTLGLVLLAIDAVLLAIGLLSIAAFRLYETELVRATEAELGGQAAIVAASYRERLAGELHACGDAAEYGAAVAAPGPPAGEAPFAPFEPRLRLAPENVLPPASDPLPGRASHPAAVVAGACLSPALREAQIRTLAGYRVVDPDGIVVASSRGEIGTSLAHREEVAAALQGETRSLLRRRITEHEATLPSISRTTGIRVFVAMPVRDGDRLLGAVVVSRTPLSMGKALYERRGLLAGGAAAALLGLGSVAVAASLLIGKPLRRLAATTEEVRLGGREVVPLLPHPRTREAAQLGRALHELSRDLTARSLAIRTFASAVSHELKNPLGAIRGSVELLRDHGETMAPEDRERFLAHIDADAARMVKLVGKLLELTRAEVLRPGAEIAGIAQVLPEPCSRHGANLTVGDGVPPVRVAPEILATTVTTLLENARQHAGPGASLQVLVGRDGPYVTIDVVDDGPGILAADRAKVFEPFYTTARETGGTGLGLAIAAALARAHGGTLTLLPAVSGAAFRLSLPAA